MTDLPITSVASAVADVIAKSGVTHVFGLLGEGNLAFAEALDEHGQVRWMAVRREDAAVCAADGYAQGTGSCGVAMVTHGPALTNTITPLVGALKGRSPVVIVTGEIAAENAHLPQYLDQGALIESVGIEYASARTANEAPTVVAAALGHALRDRRPIVVGIPTALQHAAAEHPRLTATGRTPEGHAALGDAMDNGRPASTRAGLARAVEALARAERPVIIAGRGAEADRDLVVRFARHSGALLATTLLARGLFAGEPGDLGVCGGFGLRIGRNLIEAADVALVLGAGLNDYTTGSGRYLDTAVVIQVDRDATALGRRFRPDIAVLADTEQAVQFLLDRVPGGVRYRTDEVLLCAEQARRSVEFADESDSEGMDLRTVATFLDQAFPDDRCFVSDLGYFTSEPSKYVDVRDPRRHAFCLHFGSIGLGLATSLGLAAAHPDLVTLCVVGDGGLAASLGELETLARSRLPVAVAVFNDSAYGVEWQAQCHAGVSPRLSEFPDVDFTQVAHALGIAARRVRSTSEFPATAEFLAGSMGQPVLIEFMTKRSVLTNWYRDLVDAQSQPTSRRLVMGEP